MSQFTWLHLTDLHIGMNATSHLWPNIREAFHRDLKRMHGLTGPWNAVFFTGDLVQKGTTDEFEQLECILKWLWDVFKELGSNPTLLPVPGNHDLIRPELKVPAARMLSKWNENPEIHEEFWNDANCDYRKIIDSIFSAYTGWQKSSAFIARDCQSGILPGDFSKALEFDEKRIGVIGLNTAFLQLNAGIREGGLAWDSRQLNEVCNKDGPAWCERNNVNILLTHHGIDWLNEHSKSRVLAEVAPAGRFAVHLFGHMHEARTLEQAEGGGLTQNLWQGRSLFGLENYGDEKKEARLHGYSIGRLEIGQITTLRIWPRAASFHKRNGWKMIPDHEAFSLMDDDGTKPKTVEIIQPPTLPPISSKKDSGLSLAGQSGQRNKKSTPSTVGLPRRADAGKWDWPYVDTALRPYCEAVCSAHSHIRFVEIPYFKDTSDIDIDRLYVIPRLSKQEIHPDTNPNSWPTCLEAIEELRERNRLVLLGDPGSGKSTLVSCLSWQLCRPNPIEGNIWTETFGGLIPLPMILRELRLRADLSWDALLNAFYEQRIGSLLPSKEYLVALLKTGRGIVMLDGLDEIGNLTIRRKLRDAVHAGMSEYTQARWLLTSRVVGYDQVPFHVRLEGSEPKRRTSPKAKKAVRRVRAQMSEVVYLAPFNDEQIKEFAEKWYSQHERDSAMICENAREFVQAIRENEGTQRLARIPYLLTLMALIHHKNAQLPHGRTELYERIATAYLESIDLRRRLNHLPYSLAQKKRWLADIAYRMQLRRVEQLRRRGQGEILVSKSDIRKWLEESMAQAGAEQPKREASTLLDYFAQRSGLLLPRGHGKFAFMHLSLQEYFAACFLEPRLTESRFLQTPKKMEPSNSQLRTWANEMAWRETFVLLFELLSDKSPAESEALLAHLFAHRLKNDPKGKLAIAAGLLAELATDPYVLLSAETRGEMRLSCWKWLMGLTNSMRAWGFSALYDGFDNSAIRSLLREQGWNLSEALDAASIPKSTRSQIKLLNLSRCSGLMDLRPLLELKGLTQLSLAGCTSISNLAPISKLRNLSVLNLAGCSGISDLSPMAQLKNLKELTAVGCTTIGDLSPLAKLNNLSSLSLEECAGVSDISPIGNLKSLKRLVIDTTAELTPLANCQALEELHLHIRLGAAVDLTPLAGLKQLRRLCTGYSRPVVSKALKAHPERILSPAVLDLTKEMLQAGPSRNLTKRQILVKRRFFGARSNR